ENDETLLIQSGKAVGKFKTHPDAPRVLIANTNLVGKWANWDHFRALEKKGLIMFGQKTAGSWIYIGTQGILQGTYETFVAARKAYAERTKKTGHAWVLTAGLGGMGGAQPLAATMAGLSCLAVEVDPTRIQKRLDTRYVDERIDDGDEALARIDRAKKGAEVFEYGNNFRARAVEAGCARAFDIPGFVPEYIRPQFCVGRGPFRWVALSGDPEDIAITDQAVLDAVPNDPDLRRWIELA